MRAWIEIVVKVGDTIKINVALFMRAWIEIIIAIEEGTVVSGRPLHEGVD